MLRLNFHKGARKRLSTRAGFLVCCVFAADATGVEAQPVEQFIQEYTGSLLYPNQHGEPGYSGYQLNHPVFGEKWWHPEKIPYPGSVEHVRQELQQYLPVVPQYNARTLLKNWRITAVPEIAKSQVVDYSEPVYHTYRRIRDGRVGEPTGQMNAPVKVLRWDQTTAPLSFDFGSLKAGRPYVFRVIAALAPQDVQRDTKRLVLNFEVNDGPGGQVRRYRKRIGAVEQFYSVGEFYFYAPTDRSYKGRIWVDQTSVAPLLTYNFDLHDIFAQLAASGAKKTASLYDAKAREAVWRSKATANGLPVAVPAPNSSEARAQRDEQIWNQMPALNAQIVSFNDFYPSTKWFHYVKAKSGQEAQDDGLGVDAYHTPEAQANGLTRQTAYPVAAKRWEGFYKQFVEANRQAKLYHETGDETIGRDAAMRLASLAWKLPTENANHAISAFDIMPGLDGARSAFYDRPRDMHYLLRLDWLPLQRSYDYIFPLLQGNDDLARAVGRFVPWVKTPADLIQFLDTALLQYRAHQIMSYRAFENDDFPAVMSQIAAVQQDPRVAGPWVDWLFKYAWVYPHTPKSVEELVINDVQRDGTSKIGSWFYSRGGNFANEISENLRAYLQFGGQIPSEIANVEKFPKAKAMTYFNIQSRVAGGYFYPIGDVGGPSEPRFVHWNDSFDQNLFRMGWRWTRDPDFAYLLKHDVGRGLESDEEWSRVEQSANGRHPVFRQGSRVLSDWFGLLETGTEFDDFRWRRAVGLRVGVGYGHEHNDPLDLQIWSQGVPMAGDFGQRASYTSPDSKLLEAHNTVISSVLHKAGHRWISSFADVPGMRYMEGTAVSTGVAKRQIALVDASGSEDVQPPAVPPNFHDSAVSKLPPAHRLPNSYVVDVFRIQGGEAPSYAFHGPPADEFVTNMERKHLAEGPGRHILKEFELKDTHWSGLVPAKLEATWRMRRDEAEAYGVKLQAAERRALGVNFDDSAPRKYIRMHMLGHEGAAAFGARALGKKIVHFTADALYVQPAKWTGETVFPVVYEPYSGEPFIESVRLVSPSNKQLVAASPIVLEVRLKNGRRDYVYMAPRGTKQVVVPDVGAFNGEFAVITVNENGSRKAVGVGGRATPSGRGDASPVLGPTVIEGQVITANYNTRQLTLSNAVPKESVGRVLEIGPPERRTSYTIAAIDGQTITLDKGMDIAASRVSNARPDGRFDTITPIFPYMGLAATNDRIDGQFRVGAGRLIMPDRSVNREVQVGDLIRVWEVGIGDSYRLPLITSLAGQIK